MHTAAWQDRVSWRPQPALHRRACRRLGVHSLWALHGCCPNASHAHTPACPPTTCHRVGSAFNGGCYASPFCPLRFNSTSGVVVTILGEPRRGAGMRGVGALAANRASGAELAEDGKALGGFERESEDVSWTTAPLPTTPLRCAGRRCPSNPDVCREWWVPDAWCRALGAAVAVGRAVVVAQRCLQPHNLSCPPLCQLRGRRLCQPPGQRPQLSAVCVWVGGGLRSVAGGKPCLGLRRCVHAGTSCLPCPPVTPPCAWRPPAVPRCDAGA